MRILIVTSQFPLAADPTRGRPVYQTAAALAAIAEVRVVSPVAIYPQWARPQSYLFKPPAPAQIGIDAEYVTYSALPIVTRAFNGWLCGRAIDEAVRRFRPDVVLSYWLYPDAYGAMLAARRGGYPLVSGARGSDIRVRDAVSRRLTRRVVRASQRLLVVSEDLGRLAVRDYGADGARVRVTANGCDASTFRLGDRAAARRALGVSDAAKLLVYVGRLVPEKGLRELLEAARALSATHGDLEVALIGDGPMKTDLIARIAASGAPRVRLAGVQPPSDVAQWMVASDLVVLPSYSEGHPNVLVEALACGRPIVATTVGGIPEIVDTSSGILIPPRDASALATAIGQVLDRTWDEAALSRRFSRGWDEVATDTLRACEEALDEFRRR